MISNTLNESINEFISNLSAIKRVSNNTIISYQNDLKQFIDFLEEKKIEELKFISEKIIRSFILNLNEQNFGRTSISRKLSVLRGFFNFLIQIEKLKSNPLENIHNPKLQRKLPEIITLDSYLKILKFLDEEQKDNRNNKLIFELLYGCALRVSELCNLNFGDIDLNRKSIKVLGKGSKTRLVPLGEKSQIIMEDYLSSRPQIKNSDPLILTDSNKRIYPKYVDRLVKTYFSKVSDIAKKSSHILRHSAATHMLDNGADLLGVKELLGHENLSTTQIYTHVSVERLKQAYKNAHPKS
ncbi:MAG: tyrosine-type recombinase/integrase [Ignavibacteriae bacterium]|nr:tyrosine-type recombinase/integrase [Ignavibacteriota bacterium]